jgi:hypothetical protein
MNPLGSPHACQRLPYILLAEPNRLHNANVFFRQRRTATYQRLFFRTGRAWYFACTAVCTNFFYVHVDPRLEQCRRARARLPFTRGMRT